MGGIRLIVKTITRITLGIIFLFGCYLTFAGHLTPGGGFAGGVIVAISYILFVLAYGEAAAAEKISRFWAGVIMCLGLLLFIVIALWGMWDGYFLGNFLPKGDPHDLLSAGTIPWLNLAVMLLTGAGLFLAFLLLIGFEVAPQEERGT